MTDFDEIAADFCAPPLYYATIAAMLEQHAGSGLCLEAIGVAAWAELTPAERCDALPLILGVYVTRVIEEQQARAHQEIADIDTCLGQHDEASLWDSVHDADSDETTVDKQALINVLSELDMLRRRTAPMEAAS